MAGPVHPAVAPGVRKLLRDKLGIRTSHVRSREAFRISDSFGWATITADFDHEGEAVRAADEIEAVLREAGYVVRREPGAHRMQAQKGK
jgi:hypothetical protein